METRAQPAAQSTQGAQSPTQATDAPEADPATSEAPEAPEAPAATPGAPEAPARAPGGPSRALVLSLLAVLLVLIAIIPLRHHGAVAPVDYRDELARARADAPYHVLAPDRLPIGWLVTRAAYDPDVSGAATWHLGLITPGGKYAGVAQSNGPWRLFEIRQSNRGLPHGEISVDGKLWRRQYRKERDVRTLVRMSGGVTTVVSGTASYDELELLLRSLR
jgi:uncharacterized protein DUF4245